MPTTKSVTVNDDVKKAFETIMAKKPPYDTLYGYYRGNHPLRYSTSRLRKAFDKIGTYFAMNWIAVIVDALLDRLILKGFDVEDEAADDALDLLWEKYNLQLVADDIHEAATVTGEGFAIVWKEEDDEGEIVTDVYYNDPRTCHVFYDEYRPTKKLFGAKIYIDAENYPCMILYYKDRLEHYKSQSKLPKNSGWISSAASFQLDPNYGTTQNPGVEDNEYGIVPVFHFRSGRTSGKKELGQSEISLQDAVNKLFADMMVASEYTTFKQRIIISQADPGDLANAPGTNWWIPAGDGRGQQTSVGEIGGESLDNYLTGIDKVAQAMAIISRTPKHYFMLQGGDPSGEALIALESPLTKKVKKRQEGYSVEWVALAQFILELEGKKIEKSDITPIWEPVNTIQPLTSAQVTQTETGAGIPLKTSLRRQGWGKDEMNQLEEDKKEDDTKKSKLASEALKKLRDEDAANNTNPDGTAKTPVPLQKQVPPVAMAGSNVPTK